MATNTLVCAGFLILFYQVVFFIFIHKNSGNFANFYHGCLLVKSIPMFFTFLSIFYFPTLFFTYSTPGSMPYYFFPPVSHCISKSFAFGAFPLTLSLLLFGHCLLRSLVIFFLLTGRREFEQHIIYSRYLPVYFSISTIYSHHWGKRRIRHGPSQMYISMFIIS